MTPEESVRPCVGMHIAKVGSAADLHGGGRACNPLRKVVPAVSSKPGVVDRVHIPARWYDDALVRLRRIRSCSRKSYPITSHCSSI